MLVLILMFLRTCFAKVRRVFESDRSPTSHGVVKYAHVVASDVLRYVSADVR